MRQIWKYKIRVTPRQFVEMPKGAILLDVQPQGGSPCIWALVDPDEKKISIDIVMYGTGHSFPDIGIDSYIGTCQLLGYVWHYFEGARQ